MFADGHVKWTRVQVTIANNLWKWHCFQRPGEKTFAGGDNVRDFAPGYCARIGAVSDAASCRAVASILVAAKYK
ncbi:MAG: hypothetical protein KatS3mg023_2672 [Armatimonadota bacterium]|nr:MAG: hypothetical protein KatS3mg023_2672 [Armatimonadota bacterium]